MIFFLVTEVEDLYTSGLCFQNPSVVPQEIFYDVLLNERHGTVEAVHCRKVYKCQKLCNNSKNCGHGDF